MWTLWLDGSFRACIHPQPPIFFLRSLNDWFAFEVFFNLDAISVVCNMERERERKIVRFWEPKLFSRNSGGVGRAYTEFPPPVMCLENALELHKAAKDSHFATYTPTTLAIFSYCHMSNENSLRERPDRFHVCTAERDLQFLDKNIFSFIVAFKQKHWELYRSIQSL